MESLLLTHTQITSGTTVLHNSIDKRAIIIEYDLAGTLILFKPINHSTVSDLCDIFTSLVEKYGIDCDTQHNVRGCDTLLNSRGMNYAAFIEEVMDKMANYENNNLTEINTLLKINNDASFLLVEDDYGYYKLFLTLNTEKYPIEQTSSRIQMLRSKYNIPSCGCTVSLNNTENPSAKQMMCELTFSVLAKKPIIISEHVDLLSNSMSLLLS